MIFLMLAALLLILDTVLFTASISATVMLASEVNGGTGGAFLVRRAGSRMPITKLDTRFTSLAVNPGKPETGVLGTIPTLGELPRLGGLLPAGVPGALGGFPRLGGLLPAGVPGALGRFPTLGGLLPAGVPVGGL